MYFQWVCEAKNKSKKDYHLRSLIKTIRYSQLIQLEEFEKIKSDISYYWSEIESENLLESEISNSILKINSNISNLDNTQLINEKLEKINE